MSAPLKNFNSQMLELAAEFYRGPFQDRLTRAIRAQSTREGLLSMFPPVQMPSLQPTLAMVYGVGRGDVGSDTAVFAYYDALIGNALECLAREQHPFNQCRQVLASETIIDQIQVPIENKSLLYRFHLINAFRNFFKLITGSSEVFEGPQRLWYIKVEDSEDISFMGVCLYFLTLFYDRHRRLQDEIGFINDDFVKEIFPIQFNLSLREESNERFNTLDIFELINRSGMGNLHLRATELGDSFLRAFQNLSINLSKDTLPANISNLLGSSAFLWSGMDFNREKFDLLDDSGKLYYMRKKQMEIVQKCLAFLTQETSPQLLINPQLKTEIILKVLRQHQQVQTALQVFEDLQTELTRAIAARAGAEDGLREIMRNFGNQTTAEEQAQLLAQLQASPTDVPPDMGRLGKLLVNLATKYRRQTLIQEALKEKISAQKNEINNARDFLKTYYDDLIRFFLRRTLNRNRSMNSLLSVHCVFSFFVFNADVFPQIDLSSKAKQISARRIGTMFQKKKQRRLAFEEPTDFTQTLIKSINNTAEHMFQNFVDLVEGQQQALSETDISKIKKISDVLLKSTRDEKKKFAAVERVLKKLLLENSGFIATFKGLQRDDLNLEQVIDLQVHFNTCLVAADNPLFVDATGIRNSVGFSRLSETIEKCLVPLKPNMDLFRNTTGITQQLIEFEYPPHLATSFKNNIYSVFETFKDRPEQMSLIDLEANPINPVHLNVLQKKKHMLALLRRGLLEMIPEGQSIIVLKPEAAGEAALEHETAGASLPLPRESIPAFLGEDKRVLLEYLAQMPFANQRPSIKEAVREISGFVLRENINREFLKDKNWWQRIQWNSARETHAIVLVWVHEILFRQYQAQLRSLSRLHTTSVVPATKLQPNKTAGVFDSTSLFRFYKRKVENGVEKEKISNDLFDLFLPVFISSYVAKAANLRLGRDFFLQEKIEAAKKVFPNSGIAITAMEGYLLRHHAPLLELVDYFAAEQNNATFLSPTYLSGLQEFMNQNFTAPVQYVGEKAMQAALLAAAITMWTGSPIVGILGGIAIAIFWETGVGAVKDFVNMLKQSYEFYFGNGYTIQGVNDYILDALKVAFRTEVQMCQGQAARGSAPIEPQNLLTNVLFLQEEFSIFENMQTSWIEFKERINMLVPHSKANSGMSIMLLNIFFKANEDVFSILPAELLRDVKNKYFKNASNQIIQDLKKGLDDKKAEYLQSQGGNEADCSLEAGERSGFKLWLIENLPNLAMEYDQGTIVHKFWAELSQTTDIITLSPSERMLIPVEKIGSQLGNFEKLSKLMVELSSFRQNFLGYARPVLLQNKAILKPTLNHLQTYKKFCRSCFFIINYSFALCRKLNNLDSSCQGSGLCDYWLASLNETARGVLLSPLYKETTSLLHKAAEFAASSGLQEGEYILSFLGNLSRNRETFLNTGYLDVPSPLLMASFGENILSLIGKAPENPQIITPIMVENEANPSINLPIICWDLAERNFLKDFGREGTEEILRLANSSETIALTNQIPELYFSSYGMRGFALTPFLVEALQGAVKRENSLVSLAFLGQRSQGQRRQAQQQALALSQQPSQISQQQLNQLFARRSLRPQTEPLPQPQAIMPQAQAIGPPLGPNQYPSALVQQQPQQQAEQQQPLPDMQPQQAQAAAVAAAMPQPQAAGAIPQAQPQQQPQVGDPAGQPALVQPDPLIGQEQMPQSMLPMLMLPPAPPAPQAAGAIPQEQQPMPQPQYNPRILAGAAGERQAARIASGMDPVYAGRMAGLDASLPEVAPRAIQEFGPAPDRPYVGGMNVGRFEEQQLAMQAQAAPTDMGNWQKAGMGIALAGLGGYALKKMFDSPDENSRRGRRG